MASNRNKPAAQDDSPPADDVLPPGEAETTAPADADASSEVVTDPLPQSDVDPQVVSGPAPNRSKRRGFKKIKQTASRFVPKKLKAAAPAEPDGGPDDDTEAEEKWLKKMREAAEAQQEDQARMAQGMQQLGAVLQHCWGDNVDPKRSKLSSQYLTELAQMETAEPTGDGGFKMKLKNGNSVVHGFLQGPPGEDGQPGQPIEYIKGTRWGFTAHDAHAIIALAALHGWQSVEVHGNENQKKELYLAAMAQGLDVTGYQPDEKTLQQGQLARAQFEHENPEFAPMTEDTPVVTQSVPEQAAAPVNGAFDDPVPPATGENTETVAAAAAAPEASKEPAPAKTGKSKEFDGAAADTRDADAGDTEQVSTPKRPSPRNKPSKHGRPRGR